jgi:SAM-dependent methyltransferase
MSVYHEVRLPYDATRDVIWRSLWRYYFHQFIGPDDCVLDIGCGHGAFINSVVARKRLGLDSWPDFPAYLQAGVQPVIGSAVEVGELVKEPVDFAFASNLFEHLPQTDLMMLLSGVRKILSPRGTLSIIQPNFRYAYREYFDDYTHEPLRCAPREWLRHHRREAAIPATVNQVAVVRARKSHSRLSRLADQANGQANAHPCSPAFGDSLKGGADRDRSSGRGRQGKFRRRPMPSLLLRLAAGVGALLLFAKATL